MLLRELELTESAVSSSTLDSSALGGANEVPSFPIFFERFLERKFTSRTHAIEVSYNLLASLNKFNTESDCRMLLMVFFIFCFQLNCSFHLISRLFLIL